MAADMQIEEYNVGSIMTNCYFLVNKDTKQMLLIDPGDEAKRLIGKIRERGYTLAAILLTHGHFDHTTAAKEVAEAFDAPIYAHEAEKETLENPKVNMSGGWGGRGFSVIADHYLRDGDELDLAGFHIQVLYTPGHTKGGCCYYFAENDVLISGDTLFFESIGRTDFPGGSFETLLNSIRTKLYVLPGQTQVLPGHDRHTTIGHEKQYNPFTS